jgi:hypothetical protein
MLNICDNNFGPPIVCFHPQLYLSSLRWLIGIANLMCLVLHLLVRYVPQLIHLKQLTLFEHLFEFVAFPKLINIKASKIC